MAKKYYNILLWVHVLNLSFPGYQQMNVIIGTDLLQDAVKMTCARRNYKASSDIT